jgi:hypothetical protein
MATWRLAYAPEGAGTFSSSFREELKTKILLIL